MNEIEALKALPSKEDSLVLWIMPKVEKWRNFRNNTVGKNWEDYWYLWLGLWNERFKTRQTERSKIISPISMQAVDSVVAEMEEATFGKGRWFGADDDVADEDKADIEIIADQLRDDMEEAGVPEAIAECYLIGAIYGTCIGKINVTKKKENTVDETGRVVSTERVIVTLTPVMPHEFVIDPAAKSIEDGLGIAHELLVPLHIVEEKMRNGIYKKKNIQSWEKSDANSPGYQYEYMQSIEDKTDVVKITEWHGKVPRHLLDNVPDDVKGDLVEAIVTIANEKVVLKAVPNPFLMRDRCFVAAPVDRVPGRFWGRGIVEKGYNIQKALDAEIRARIDGLALTVHPMMGVDITKARVTPDFKVGPGKNLFTIGKPSDIIQPFNFGTIDPMVFKDAAELERMHQVATGAIDTAAPLSVVRRNQTAAGMSMIQGAVIKRHKRILRNVENNFLKPLITKFAWRYMQFAPDRYQTRDYRFRPYSAMGIMAREYEMSQLAQLLQTVPPDNPAYWLLLQSIYENSGMEHKEEMLQIIKQTRNALMQPKQDPKLQLEMMDKQLEAKRIELEAMRLQIERERDLLKAQHLEKERELKELELQIKAEQAYASAQKDLAQAQKDTDKDGK